jgi:hypothetical protein
MLPSKEKATIWKDNINKLHNAQTLTKSNAFDNNGSWYAQHLYIVSDEEIKEGDWYLNIPRNEVQQYENNHIEIQNLKQSADKVKKLIATTDTSLNLPTIPQSFITHFINEYNKGNVIDKVMVEYFDSTGGFTHIQKIKVLPDNTINIKPCKDSYTREEVETIVHNFGKSINAIEHITVAPMEYIDDWLDNNL